MFLIMMPTFAFFAVPKHVEAQAGLFSCAALFGFGAGTAAAGIIWSAGSVPVYDAAVTTTTAADVHKECLDAIAYAIAKIAIQSISQSILNWINSGFEGGPAFVTDLDQFLREIDLQAFEEFLGSDAIAFLCSPWRFDIQFALELQFAMGTNVPECSLGDVVDNIDGFLAGDFSQGGLDGWYRLVTYNNPYRDYLTVESEWRSSLAAAESREVKLLDFGRGFLSFEQCTSRPANPGDSGTSPGDTIEDCSITTPGAVIESQLENVLGSGIRQLELADEINEIVSAFIQQVINQVITSGLRSL